jgi:hypothetical protein
MPGPIDGLGPATWIGEHYSGTQEPLTSRRVSNAEPTANQRDGGPLIAKPYETGWVLDWIERLRECAARGAYAGRPHGSQMPPAAWRRS